MFHRSAICLLMLAAALGAQSHNNAFTCVTCHTQQAVPQPSTPMGQALSLGVKPSLQSHPPLTFRSGDYSYLVTTDGPRATYTVSDGKDKLTVPIRWAFGAGSQTYVLEYEGKMYESLATYYSAIDGLDTTMGDNAIVPHSLKEALGRELATTEVRSCFGCHSTGAVEGGALHLQSMRPGVACDHCHAGTAAHQQNIAHGSLSDVPKKLGQMSAEDTSTFCGQCHRSWETVIRNGWHGIVDVRFQPYRLENSKCFDGSDARISCTGCHDPHKNLVTDTSAYDPKCLSCHSPSAVPVNSNGGAKVKAKLCPVETKNCASCHMPKIELLGGHMTFHDHQIRVVRADEPFPN